MHFQLWKLLRLYCRTRWRMIFLPLVGQMHRGKCYCGFRWWFENSRTLCYERHVERNFKCLTYCKSDRITLVLCSYRSSYFWNWMCWLETFICILMWVLTCCVGRNCSYLRTRFEESPSGIGQHSHVPKLRVQILSSSCPNSPTLSSQCMIFSPVRVSRGTYTREATPTTVQDNFWRGSNSQN